MVEYDPFLPQVIEDPHPVYAKLREEDPCCFIEKYDTYFLSRFDDIWNASMDEKSFSTESGTTFAQLVKKIQPLTPMINNMDPPRHTHLRSKVVPYFTPGGVRKLEPQIAKFVADAFAEVKDQKEADLFNDFAAKVSVKVACLANGFPMEDSDMLNGLVWRFFGREEGVEGMTQDGVNAMMEMFTYFGELIARRRAAGADGQNVVDLICRYEDEEGRGLDVESASSHLSMFLIGGAETFPKTFASAVHRFWQHPDQRADLVKDASLIPEAYREVLRYDMPTQFLMRKVLEPVSFHDKTLQPGQNLAFLYPSANRDRLEFEEPDRFDIRRAPPRILSFGHGTHLCIGQHFARMEAKHCIQTLLDWAPEYEVKENELRRLKTEFVQGWESMPVVFGR
jgi:cytochrome P450